MLPNGVGMLVNVFAIDYSSSTITKGILILPMPGLNPEPFD
jgi:hypothetical protein